jgi:2'-5' RNA ligase
MPANERQKNLRLFIACLLPQEALSALAEAREQFLKEGAPKLRWIRPEGIHLTLKFLGEVPEARIPDIEAKRLEAMEGLPAFSLSLDGMGTFGGRKGPRVLWAGLAGDLDKLIEVQRRVDEAMAALDFPREDRPFRPHLTLARASNDLMAVQQRHLEGLARKVTLPQVQIPVLSVNLMHSTLHPNGAIYTELGSLPLQA